MFLIFSLATVFLSSVLTPAASERYDPNWNSIDSRPIPDWFDDAKVGIFLHWGVFSVPSFSNSWPAEWFWWSWKGGPQRDVVDFMNANYPPDFTYADFAPQFRAEFFDPYQWVNLFKDAGAKYIVLISKHCEGYTNWPSKYSFNWNSVDVGPKRDLVGDLAKALRNNTDIRLGLYHALQEWFHPLYLQDKANGYKTTRFPKEKAIPELYEIVNNYKPDLVWSDGIWEASDTYWNSTDFLAWLYNDSPIKDHVVTNDRWGKDTLCHHGGYYTCDDHYNPGVLQKHKWENCMSIDGGSWGYRRNAPLSAYLSVWDLISELASTVSCGGNLLMNVGPTADGRIDPIFEERLRQFGSWLKINGEAIYSSKPWSHQNDTITSGVWYTSQKTSTETVAYAIVLHWPKSWILTLGSPNPTSQTKVSMLGYSREAFEWKQHGPTSGIDVTFPYISPNDLPSEWAWVLKLENLA